MNLRTPTCIIRGENRRKTQPEQTKNGENGEHNRVVRIGLCGDNKGGTLQELLEATH